MINANKTANINQPSTSGPNKNIDSYGVAPDGSIVRVDWSTWPLYDGKPNNVTTPNKRIVAHVDGVPVQSGEDIAPIQTITPNHREVTYGINDEGNPAPLVQTGYGVAVMPDSASSPNKTNLVWVIGEDGSPIPLQVDEEGYILGVLRDNKRYIEFDGSSWIDTLILVKDTFSVKAKYTYTTLPSGDNMFVFGSTSKPTANRIWFGAESYYAKKICFGLGHKGYNYFDDISADLNIHNIEIDALRSIAIYDKIEYPVSVSWALPSNKTIFLGAINNTNDITYHAKAKVYSFVIKDDDEMICDLYPVYENEIIEGKIAPSDCFYDFVSKAFFENQGTGTLVFGRDGYEKVEGNPVGIEGEVKELLLSGETVQAGSGNPSPTNIREISGDAFIKDDSGTNILPEDIELFGQGGVFDTYDSKRGILTRRFARVALTGSESGITLDLAYNRWYAMYTNAFPGMALVANRHIDCSHYDYIKTASIASATPGSVYHASDHSVALSFNISGQGFTSLTDLKNWLASEAAAGRPITIVYELATPVIEYVDPISLKDINSGYLVGSGNMTAFVVKGS